MTAARRAAYVVGVAVIIVAFGFALRPVVGERTSGGILHERGVLSSDVECGSVLSIDTGPLASDCDERVAERRWQTGLIVVAGFSVLAVGRFAFRREGDDQWAS